MNDYPPLHSPDAFSKYLQKFKTGEEVTAIPIIPKHIVIDYFRRFSNRFNEYEDKLNQFLAANPDVEYFSFDGKHRSAAAVVADKQIPCVLIENDNDFIEILNSGKYPRLESTIDATLKIMEEHYFSTKKFWTIETKVKEIIKDRK